MDNHSSNIKLSVVICTYNPDDKIFLRCLSALSNAMEDVEVYEVKIIDNNSSRKLLDRDYINDFLQLHVQTEVIVEQKQGLTPARIRGIEETKGDVILFIDDDNFIQQDYLKEAIAIAEENPFIGSWSGQVELEFEQTPPEWVWRYRGMLVHRELDKDKWSNLHNCNETMPCGAGLLVRRNVAEYYVNLHAIGKRQIQLDRKGDSLFSGGDNDLAACASDLNMGLGLFQRLRLIHFIPKKRIQLDYMLRLAESIAASSVVFNSFRGPIPQRPNFKRKVANFIRLFLIDSISRKFNQAELRGIAKGIEMVEH